MRQVEYFELISNLSDFKTMTTQRGEELVFFKNATIYDIDAVEDKTWFEAAENHIHLLDNVRKSEFDALIPVAQKLGRLLLGNLKFPYPDKRFMVFVSLKLNDSMIIRFHQIWEYEYPYCNPEEYVNDNERVFMFEA